MLFDWLQNLFNRIPKFERRHLQRSSPRPKPGDFVCRHNLMMRVTQAVPGEFWDWMLSKGWRGVDPFKDRRHYVLVYHEAYVDLLRADVFTRDEVHDALLARYPEPTIVMAQRMHV